MKPLAGAALTAALTLALLALAVACGGGPPNAARSPTPDASPAATATSAAGPSPIASPMSLAGVTLYPYDQWFDEDRSACASISLEAPFFGPEVFGIRDEQVPQIDLPAAPTDVRACRDGFVAIAYIGEGYLVRLASGGHEWPVRATAEQISEGTIAGRPAVFVEPGEDGGGAMVIIAEDFGMAVVSLTSTLEEAKQIAEALHDGEIIIPQGRESLVGPLRGIRFYDNLHDNNRKEGCAWGGYGLEDERAQPAAIPTGSPLDVVPSYLPEGYTLAAKRGTSCGGALDLVEAEFSREAGAIGFVVLRLTGERAWYAPQSEDWMTLSDPGELPSVYIAPPSWATGVDDPVQVVASEGFGLTVVSGNVPLEEAIRVAEGLNR
jgi:hypothetical protein